MSTNTDTWMIGSLLVAFVSGMTGHLFGGREKVSEATCAERRCACNDLVIERITHLADNVESLEKKIDKLT